MKESKNTTPTKAKDVPVTQNMLYEVRDELKEYTNSKFNDLKSEVHEVKSEVHGLKSEIHEVKSEVHGLKSEIHEVKSAVHEVRLLVEEQNAKNNIVLDGLTSLFERQERLEANFK